MLDTLKSIVEVANALTPGGGIALLAVIVYYLAKGRKQMDTLTVNHLHDLPEMKRTLKDIQLTLVEGFADLRATLRERK